MAIARHQSLSPNLTIPQTPSAITGVSGTATVGGTATLTATLSLRRPPERRFRARRSTSRSTDRLPARP